MKSKWDGFLPIKEQIKDEFNTSDYEDEMMNTKLKFSNSSLEKSDSDQYYCTPENISQALLVTCSLFTTTPSLSLFSVYPPHVCNPYFPLSEQRILNKYCQESGGQDNYLGHVVSEQLIGRVIVAMQYSISLTSGEASKFGEGLPYPSARQQTRVTCLTPPGLWEHWTALFNNDFAS
uniref:Uncharacterized protein n=1 Tax=Timema douglasi TaxID=61478 RepID=A0A7R8VFY1_TIMDO|nr:unnamed protein product [Timema douglasi]